MGLITCLKGLKEVLSYYGIKHFVLMKCIQTVHAGLKSFYS